jgi:hypothetical protein
LTQLQIPSSFANLGSDVFRGVTLLQRLTLLGSALSPGVVANLEGCLAPAARVFGPSLVGKRLAGFSIAA